MKNINSEDQSSIEHIQYEIDMFQKTFAYLRIANSKDNFDTSTERNIKNNCYLESFLIHARNLIDFLTATKNENHPYDIIAAKLVESEMWKIKRGKFDTDFRQIKTDINKRLAHITKIRFEAPDRDLPNIYTKITNLLTAFQVEFKRHKGITLRIDRINLFPESGGKVDTTSTNIIYRRESND